jgi:hypothetical protein
MPTEELEQELRRVLGRAAADIQHPEQARQRLLQHRYRPGRGHRPLAGAVTAATAATAVVLGLGLAGTFSPARAHGTGTIRTAAFTLTEHANGTATLAIAPRVLVYEPGTLQNDLRRDGIAATVTTGSFCSSDPVPSGFGQVVSAQAWPANTITINPAAMPAGTELSFGDFQLSGSQEIVFELIDPDSYTCTSTAPTTPPPAGEGGFMNVKGLGSDLHGPHGSGS